MKPLMEIVSTDEGIRFVTHEKPGQLTGDYIVDVLVKSLAEIARHFRKNYDEVAICDYFRAMMKVALNEAGVEEQK